MIVEFIQRYALAGLGVALAVSMAATGAQSWRLKTAQTALATQAKTHADERARSSAAATAAEQAARTEETRRVKALAEVVRQQADRASRAEADAARASVAARGLRDRAAALATGRGGPAGDPATAAKCAPARAAGLVLADVLGRVEQRGRDAAAALEAAHGAGITCEQSYDAVKGGVAVR